MNISDLKIGKLYKIPSEYYHLNKKELEYVLRDSLYFPLGTTVGKERTTYMFLGFLERKIDLFVDGRGYKVLCFLSPQGKVCYFVKYAKGNNFDVKEI